MKVKLKKWQSCGEWHCAYVDTFSPEYSNWLIPPRQLGLEIDEYIKLVLKNHTPDKIHWDEDRFFLYFTWSSEVACSKYMKWVNAGAGIGL